MITEIIIAALLAIGGTFGLVGSYGLVKLPDLMTRLHAPTKASTLGVGGVLLASMADAALRQGTVSWHELLVTLFLFLTAPITANFIAKAHIARAMPREPLPPTGTARDWATLDLSDEPVMPQLTPPGRPGRPS
ncbi:multisubunit potassium/proton antiporter, PhaG subunit (TC 2.A.63.1.1) [Gemmobacter aquatilis]|uniref:Multisubunit potassium/proton antiporter, PhaG subunit (TC 2.A.63.1.1) n=1 Tax=Gemmobacter aquatilis TaxID=933059 RepID=A0A1H8IZZ3_9RHOB|nr:Na+/H+ antiporter subunit G [Gemmobacter aquatilis]SEN73298.1 multisubunit potassium/proton antiporter, PhaG subunit (TC 2.A.63.1.1) [Gemmobacter aquatilis]